MANNFKVAVLATGGMDSTVLLYDLVSAGHEPAILYVDYGQRAALHEIRLLFQHAAKLKLPIPIVLNHKFSHGVKKGLFEEGYKLKNKKSGDAVDEYKEGEMKYNEMYIEGRNAFIALTALSYCSANKIDELHCGFVNNQATWDKQRTAFHLFTNDSSPHFVEAINLLALTSFSHYVRLKAPYLDDRSIDKYEIFHKAIRHGIDVENETHSCYFYPPCGECLSCKTKTELLSEETML